MRAFLRMSGPGLRLRQGLAQVLLAILLASCVTFAVPAAGQTADARDEPYGEGLEPFATAGPLMAVISINRQKIDVWDANGIVASAPVSTGRNGHETPEGVFSIIERKVEHNSNLYDDAEMPFMQRLTWSGVALHQGNVPGYRASHGCIRLPDEFAERLFRTTRIATRVIIAPHDAPPQRIRHAALFQPAMIAPSVPPSPATPVVEPVALSPLLMPDDGAEIAAAQASSPDQSAQATLSPAAYRAYLAERRARVTEQLAQATRDANAARETVRPLLLEQGRAEKGLRQALALERRFEGRLEALVQAREQGGSTAAMRRLDSSIAEAREALAKARQRRSDAQVLAAQKVAAASTVKQAVKALDDNRNAVLNESRRLWRRSQPVTVLISRATGKIHVRRAFHDVVTLPLTIRDPERPLGTHVFTALAAENDGDELAWMGLTLVAADGKPPIAARSDEDKSRRRRSRKPEPAAVTDPLQSARAALDRIVVQTEALSKILPSLQVGSTLILSDLGPSIETGPGTDIVVQTKGEDAAAASIARFLAKKRENVAQDDDDRRDRRRSAEYRRSGDWQRW